MKDCEVRALARSLLDKHGLNHYKLRFTHAKDYIGRTWVRPPKIHISLRYTRPASRIGVRAVLLHEIAHTMSSYGHGSSFKAAARAIGCPVWAIGEAPSTSRHFRTRRRGLRG